MLRLAFFLLAFPLLLAAGCAGSDLAAKSGWPGSYNDANSAGNGE